MPFWRWHSATEQQYPVPAGSGVEGAWQSAAGGGVGEPMQKYSYWYVASAQWSPDCSDGKQSPTPKPAPLPPLLVEPPALVPPEPPPAPAVPPVLVPPAPLPPEPPPSSPPPQAQTSNDRPTTAHKDPFMRARLAEGNRGANISAAQ